MALKIKLKPKEKIVINGAVVSAGEQGSILFFLNKARILMEKDVMTEEDVTSPESNVYFLLQLIYIDPDDQPRYAQQLQPVVEELLQKSPDKKDEVERILEIAAQGDLFKAMRLAKKAFNLTHGPSNEE